MKRIFRKLQENDDGYLLNESGNVKTSKIVNFYTLYSLENVYSRIESEFVEFI